MFEYKVDNGVFVIFRGEGKMENDLQTLIGL